VLRDPGRAEDAVQDAFLKLWNGASGFDPGRGSMRIWLMTAVRNRSIDFLRGRGAREREEQELPDNVATLAPDPQDTAELSFERQEVRAALAELPAEQRQAVLLAYFGGYTQLEIAGLTGVPLSTVKGRMRLALDKLAAYLKERGVVDG
jgi:RNA polymerase sigma-70 factor (ECF subfamily)